jgi:parvulin-like peptidyl-prolyl isomerase
MKRLPLFVVLLTLAAVLVAAGCGGGGGESVPEGAVASVDGEPITKDELDELLDRAKVSYESQQQEFPRAGTAEYQSLQTQATAFLVKRLQYEVKAKELGIEVTDKAVDGRIAQVKKEFFGGDEKQLQKQLKEQGYTDASFRADIRAQLITDRLFEEITKDVSATDAEVKKYYDQNKAQYDVPESRQVRHILVECGKQGQPSCAAAKKLADDIYEQLESGASFAALAKKYSDDPGSKDTGGELMISRGQTVPQFDKTAFLLATNTISRPVKTEYGYHVIQPISEVKPARTTSFDEAKPQIRAQLVDQKKNQTVSDWANELQTEFEGKTAYADGFAPPDLTSDDQSSQSGG